MGTVLKDLLTRAPENLSGWLLRAEWAQCGRDRAKALDSLERVVELDPRKQGSLLALAHSLEDADRQEEALGTYRQLLADDPDHDLGTNGHGVLLYRMSRVDRAVEVFQGLLRSQPFFPPAHLNLAIIRFDQNRYRDARSLVERALVLRPRYGIAHELRALLLEKEGGSPATLEAWKAALRFATTREAYRRAEAAVQRLEKRGTDLGELPDPVCPREAPAFRQRSAWWTRVPCCRPPRSTAKSGQFERVRRTCIRSLFI